MKQFMDENFLLDTKTAQDLFHNHAAKMPIIDYHCHLIPEMVANDHKFKSITELWLGGDHYKWRAMRTNGVHLGQEDMDPAEARRILGPEAIIGVSAHNVAEARAAVEAGADYLGCGAMFATATKTNVTALPKETLRAICTAVPIPVVAIGGIHKQNLLSLAHCGEAGVALVSAIFAAKDIEAECRELRALVEQL